MSPGFLPPFGAPALASCGILLPPGTWAVVASGLPAAPSVPPDPDGVPRSACTSSDRGGRPLYPGASGVHAADEDLPGRRLPVLPGQALQPGPALTFRAPG
jgi:hypothetical protein